MMPSRFRNGYSLANSEQGTALDEDLLQERDVEVIDDSGKSAEAIYFVGSSFNRNC
jgi:hypothetical protein